MVNCGRNDPNPLRKVQVQKMEQETRYKESRAMTNPNPVAPKTDTPQGEIPQELLCGHCHVAVKQHAVAGCGNWWPVDRATTRATYHDDPYASMSRDQLIDAIHVASSHGWQLAHESRSCGHPRAFYRDKNFPASEDSYDPETGIADPPMVYRCELCNLESTLAAERASRLQAEEALDSLKMEIMVLYGCDTPEVAFSEIEYLIKKYFPPPSKPSVSPEQEKP